MGLGYRSSPVACQLTRPGPSWDNRGTGLELASGTNSGNDKDCTWQGKTRSFLYISLAADIVLKLFVVVAISRMGVCFKQGFTGQYRPVWNSPSSCLDHLSGVTCAYDHAYLRLYMNSFHPYTHL